MAEDIRIRYLILFPILIIMGILGLSCMLMDDIYRLCQKILKKTR